MHKISDTFLHCLQTGFLSEITKRVKKDRDLNLEIRENYINIYFKGNALLKLTEAGVLQRYKVEIHKKFSEGLEIPFELTEGNVHEFVTNMPFIKENIIKYGQRSIELEYEQMIIRANNYEPRNNTEYFIVDRQYTVKEGRFDLTGIHWKMQGRQKNRKASVCLMEIKFALNQDIQHVHEQLAKYYGPIKNNAAKIAEEMEAVFKQKLELGLYNHPLNRLNAMKTLRFSKDIDDFQFILVLVDYNPNSRLFALDELKQLPFATQIKVFRSGFGMWEHNVIPIQNSGVLERSS
jgi:hypothetical protein